MNAHSKTIEPSRRDLVVGASLVGGALLVGCSPADLLAAYYHAVHKMSLEYVASVTAEELGRVVDENWSPPVTASVRLVSIIDDCAQHLGQANYVLGIAP